MKKMETPPATPMKKKEAHKESKVSFHGYGDLHYNNPRGGGLADDTQPATLDLHRMVWGLSYSLNDRWSLYSKIDFSHDAKEIEVKAAYIEYKAKDSLPGFRAGNVVMPIGPMNESSAPILYYSVERPYIQKFIIPTSWNGAGMGLFGETASGLKYRLYMVEGLDTAKFSKKEGIRNGRQVLSDKENNADKFGGVGRLEYVGVTDLTIGASYYKAAAVGIKNASVALWDVDLKYKIAGFDLSFLEVRTKIQEAAAISAAVGETVGAEQAGRSMEVAYHLTQANASIPDIVPFYRVEQFSTQGANPNYEVHTYGLAYFPDPNIVMKADQEQWRDGNGKKGTRMNLGIGFIF